MAQNGLSRQTEMILGSVFLALMVVFIVLAITTFEGTPTVLLVVGALVFLGVGLFFFAGGRSGSDGDGPSQQQSVILDGGRVVTQSSGGVLAVCAACGARSPESSRFCPECGAKMG